MQETLKSLGVARLGAMAGITAALFGFFAYLMTGMSQAPMSLLFAGLDPKDSTEIVKQLESARVPFKVEGDGSTIMVASEQALRLRMDFAGKGLPSGGNVGYEVFDRMDTLGQTSFVQGVNMVRALEGELARTIRAIDAVANARVHLVMPKKELFASQPAAPSASVVLRSRGGRLRADQVQAVRHLVASAVNGLLPEAVTVIDEKGILLANGNDGGNGAIQADDRTQAFEERLRLRVEDMLARIVGPGRARVQVSAEVDFAKTTRSSETFDPNGQVLRSSTTRNEKAQDQDKRGENAVTQANNLPQAAQTASGGAGGTQSSSNKDNTEETVNYEISKTTETQIEEQGKVKRLSVAVVVDGTYTSDTSGTRTYAARPAEEMKELEQLVRSAIGFDEKRGDTLKVTNLRFSEPEAEPIAAPEEALLGLEKEDYWRIAQYGGVTLLALILIFFILRPLVRALTAGGAGGSAGALAQLPGTAIAGAAALAPGAQGQALPAQGQAALPAPAAGSMIDIAQIDGQVKESSVRKVGEIINKHPEEATAIMRQWLHETAS